LRSQYDFHGAATAFVISTAPGQRWCENADSGH
jgi:hypothetical protein